jgi:hypothetical protein
MSFGLTEEAINSAYILDPESGTGMSQDHQFLAQSIAERYPNVRLAQVPLNVRDKREEFPFALTDALTGNVLKELRETECNISFVYQWLYEHDTAARGVKAVYEKFKADQAAKAKAVNDDILERRNENLDIFQTIAKSPLHTFKHGDRKIG